MARVTHQRAYAILSRDSIVSLDLWRCRSLWISWYPSATSAWWQTGSDWPWSSPTPSRYSSPPVVSPTLSITLKRWSPTTALFGPNAAAEERDIGWVFREFWGLWRVIAWWGFVKICWWILRCWVIPYIVPICGGWWWRWSCCKGNSNPLTKRLRVGSVRYWTNPHYSGLHVSHDRYLSPILSSPPKWAIPKALHSVTLTNKSILIFRSTYPLQIFLFSGGREDSE